jgi:hypothetical protein
VWGLDVYALDMPGDWVFTFGLDGPQGAATSAMTIPVLEQPGPPLGLSWLGSTVPLLVMLGVVAAGLVTGGRRRMPA